MLRLKAAVLLGLVAEGQARLVRVAAPAADDILTYRRERLAISELPRAYAALGHWLEASGYEIVGPYCEVYLRGSAAAGAPDHYLTEIQFPVRRPRHGARPRRGAVCASPLGLAVVLRHACLCRSPCVFPECGGT